MVGELGLAAELDAIGLCSLHTAPTAGKNALALILHGAEEGNEAPPKRRSEVEVRLVEHL